MRRCKPVVAVFCLSVVAALAGCGGSSSPGSGGAVASSSSSAKVAGVYNGSISGAGAGTFTMSIDSTGNVILTSSAGTFTGLVSRAGDGSLESGFVIVDVGGNMAAGSVSGAQVVFDGKIGSSAFTGSGWVASAPGQVVSAPPSVTCPTGTYFSALTYSCLSLVPVSSGGSTSAGGSVTPVVGGSNVAPVAKAAGAISAVAGQLVSLDGSGSSDPNGDALSYSWSVAARPAGEVVSLAGANTAKPTFTPKTAGSYTFLLTVSDGKLSSTTTESVTVAAAPTANAGAPQTVDVGALVTLAGSGSSDTGATLSYKWTMTARPQGSNAAVSRATAAQPTFTPDLAGAYTFSLIVSDGVVDSETSVTSVVAVTPAATITATVGAAQNNVIAGTQVTLSGAASVPGASFSWAVTSAPPGVSVMLSSPTVAGPTFVPPAAGTYVFSLVVSRGTAVSPAATTTVSVVPSTGSLWINW